MTVPATQPITGRIVSPKKYLAPNSFFLLTATPKISSVIANASIALRSGVMDLSAFWDSAMPIREYLRLITIWDIIMARIPPAVVIIPKPATLPM